MRGMLLRDWKVLWPWLVCGFLGAACLFPLVHKNDTALVLYIVLMQMYAMAPVRVLVQNDRVYGWKQYIAMMPGGRRKYAAEKFLLMLLFFPVLMAGEYAGVQLWVLSLGGGFLPMLFMPYKELACAFYFGMTALQLPMQLLVFNSFMVYWEILTWALSLSALLWLRNSHIFAWYAARQQGNAPAPEEIASLEYIRFSQLNWEGMAIAAVCLFLLTAVMTVWLAGDIRGRGLFEKGQLTGGVGQFFRANGKQLTAICGIVVALLTALWILDTHMPERSFHIYSKPSWKGGSSYLITNLLPDEVQEKYWYEEFTYEGAYTAYDREAEIAGVTGGKFLIWDGEWFLWEMETDARTPVALPEDERIVEVQLLDSPEPEVVALWRYDEPDVPGGASGFFSIKEDCMITDFVYGSWGDELIDGMIAAEDADDNWVLIDPATGEITGTLPGRP